MQLLTTLAKFISCDSQPAVFLQAVEAPSPPQAEPSPCPEDPTTRPTTNSRLLKLYHMIDMAGHPQPQGADQPEPILLSHLYQ